MSLSKSEIFGICKSNIAKNSIRQHDCALLRGNSEKCNRSIFHQTVKYIIMCFHANRHLNNLPVRLDTIFGAITKRKVKKDEFQFRDGNIAFS